VNPLTGIYGAVSSLRNRLFDRGTLTVHRLQKPVVSVGNLSVGGAGKTPFVIMLGELLKARGIRFDVLSRGYGRKTRGVLVVDPNGSASDFGDEPLLIARKLGVPVVVGESRYQAGRLAEQKFDVQLHILDDGFQHRSLARDFDIVLLTERDFKDQLLPAGRLREPLSALTRADLVIMPAGFAFDNSDIQYKPRCEVKRSLAVHDSPDRPVAFCGIARPEQFFAQVRAAGIQPAAQVVFRDHHSYRAADIERLKVVREKSGASGFVTTEKDAINLGPLRSELAPLAIAGVVLAIFSPAKILDAIFQKLAANG